MTAPYLVSRTDLPNRSSLEDGEETEDRATLLGLYHGYDQARVLLATLVARYGADPRHADTNQALWRHSRRRGFSQDIHHPPCEIHGEMDAVNRAAHSAALTAFAAISDQAESLLRVLRERWPELREDAGGPLPSPPASSWDLD